MGPTEEDVVAEVAEVVVVVAVAGRRRLGLD